MNQCPNVFSMSKLKSKSSKCWKSNSVSKELSKSKLQSKISDIRLFFIKFKFKFIKFNDSWYTASSLTESMICYIFINLVALQSSSMFFFPYQEICTKTIQNVYKILQNTKLLQRSKIVQIKILYDNECTKNVLQIPTYIQKMYQLYKTCTKLRLKTA